MPLKLLSVSSSTGSCSPRNASVLPAERADASSLRLDILKFRSARTVRNSVPTAPVAPMIATRMLIATILP